MIVHLKNSLENGLSSILIRTVDTDVVVILIGEIPRDLPRSQYLGSIWNRKHFRHYYIITLCEMLGKDKSCSLPPFLHASQDVSVLLSSLVKPKSQHRIPGTTIQM